MTGKDEQHLASSPSTSNGPPATVNCGLKLNRSQSHIATPELRSFWEVPAVAHFCSLFRSIFKLIDFDIEEFEEALLIDSCGEGTRHSTIVDLLIALLAGCTGRKDISLLNYNQFLHDLVGYRWKADGLGQQNPLGKKREKANFHSLPLYPKVKLIEWLCQLRLSRPDVEPLTKNLDGDNLRVISLGQDEKGAKFWYFYGTRLYKEDPEPVKIKIETFKQTPTSKASKHKGKRGKKGKGGTAASSVKSSGKKQQQESGGTKRKRELTPPPSTPLSSTGSRRSARSSAAAAAAAVAAKPDSSKSSSATTPLSTRRSSRRQAARNSNNNESIVAEEEKTDDSKRNEEEEEMEEDCGESGVGRNSKEETPATVNNDDEEEEDEDKEEAEKVEESDSSDESSAKNNNAQSNSSSLCHKPPSLVSRLKPKLQDIDSDAAPSSPNPSEAEGFIANRNMNDMISRMYSRDDDEMDETASSVHPPSNNDDEDSRQEVTGNPEDLPLKTDSSTAASSTSSGVVKTEENKDYFDDYNEAEGKQSQNDAVVPEDTKDIKSEINEQTKTENMKQKVKSEQEDGKDEEEEEENGPPAWDQLFLTADKSQTNRWHLVCQTLEDWQNLVDKLNASKNRQEKDLHKLLANDFLPEMEEMFRQKAKEEERKLAELNRRTSERVGMRKVQEEDERKKLERREKDEKDRIAKIEHERRRKHEVEERASRMRNRDKEKERERRVKERAREERSRRLEFRQQRQQFIAEGKDIPEELSTSANMFLNDKDLNELDIEIELDNMYGQLEKVVDQLKKHPDAEPFVTEISDEFAPRYSEIIKTPMYLEKLEDNLMERVYKNKLEFIDDVNLIFLNCLEYNGVENEYTRLAQHLERGFIRAWKKYFPPQYESEEADERSREENWECVEKLGALDRKINARLYPSREPAPKRSRMETTTSGHFTRTLPTPLPPPAPRAPLHARSSAGTSRLSSVYGHPGRTSRTVLPSSQNSPYRIQPAGRQTYSIPSSSTPSIIRSAGPKSGGGMAMNPASAMASPNLAKPSVYLLPSSDGDNRLLKFVYKNGDPAPHSLIQHLLPQLKKEAHTLPKGLLTLTVDSQDVPAGTGSNEGGGPSTSNNNNNRLPTSIPPPLPSASSGNNIATTTPVAPSTTTTTTTTNPMQQSNNLTPMQPNQPVSIQSKLTSGVVVSRGDGGEARLAAPATPSTSSAAGMPMMETPKSKRFYHIGDNSYLAIEEGTPFLYKKQADGSLVRIQQVSRDGLLEKLKIIQQKKNNPKEGTTEQSVGGGAEREVLREVAAPQPQPKTINLPPRQQQNQQQPPTQHIILSPSTAPPVNNSMGQLQPPQQQQQQQQQAPQQVVLIQPSGSYPQQQQPMHHQQQLNHQQQPQYILAQPAAQTVYIQPQQTQYIQLVPPTAANINNPPSSSPSTTTTTIIVNNDRSKQQSGTESVPFNASTTTSTTSIHQ